MSSTPNPVLDLDPYTEAAEERDAVARPAGGPTPTPDEEAAAERAAANADPDAQAAYKEQLQRGAAQEAEGAMTVANDGRAPEV